ncbi:hypothetical protein D3C79_840630 [compost metagenome]
MSNKPTGEANDSKQSLRSVDSFSYLLSIETVPGRSSVSDKVCTQSLLLPTRTSSFPRDMSCKGSSFALERVKYWSRRPGSLSVPVISSLVSLSIDINPLSFKIRSNCATASMNLWIFSLSRISLGIKTPLQSEEKLDCIRIRSLLVLVRNR